MNLLIEVLRQIVPLSNEEAAMLLNICKPVCLNKGDYWIKAGKLNASIAFVDDGYLRKYYVKDGVEITDFFYFDSDFSADLPSILGNTLPHADIVAMKRTNLTVFPYHEFNTLCKTLPAFEHLHRVILEQTFLRFYKRSVSFILQSPKERYDELVAGSPQVLQHAAQYHIASYLGISPQHLSRLRSAH